MRPPKASRSLTLALAALGAVAAAGMSRAEMPAMSVDAADLDRGAELYAQHCAICHGADLQGQPDWREPGPDGRLPAPPHDESGHTWHHGDRLLFDYTRRGGAAALESLGIRGYDSGMPAFGALLSDTEIRDILAFIKSTWPERVRDYQAEATRNEQP